MSAKSCKANSTATPATLTRPFEIEVVVSSKFDLVDYLRSFSTPGRYREARVEAVSLDL